MGDVGRTAVKVTGGRLVTVAVRVAAGTNLYINKSGFKFSYPTAFDACHLQLTVRNLPSTAYTSAA